MYLRAQHFSAPALSSTAEIHPPTHRVSLTSRVFVPLQTSESQAQQQSKTAYNSQPLEKEKYPIGQDAAMSNERGPRVANAIHSLIDHLVPSDAQDDRDSADERHDACFQLARSIFER